MPIVQISKIQHRYGLLENLPQLSGGELGWALDQRRLFIGNGPTAEGAPYIGNTEILTEFSNLLQVGQNAYTYLDDAVGYNEQTGPLVGEPTYRSIQAKLDDFVNVRDFGAKGDGITDDTEAINRALFQIYCKISIIPSRRVLYFPAGTYLVDVMKIPSHANIQGEGMNSTIIMNSNSAATCVARTADSKQQTGATIGANGGVAPQYITIRDISFYSDKDIDIFLINSTTSIRCERVLFKGSFLSPPSTAGNSKRVLGIYSTALLVSSNVIFDNCEFAGSSYGAVLDDELNNVIFNNCKFYNLYKGLKIGEGTVGTGPQGLRITNSLFDKIYSNGLHVFITGITSAFNTYLDVGNHNILTPTDNVILFVLGDNASICDFFARTDLQDATSARVNMSSKASYYIKPSDGMYLGLYKREAGASVTLSNNISSATTTGITFTTTQMAQKIFYRATRGTNVRQGVLDLTATSNGVTLSDNYTYDGTDIGLTLSASVSGSTVTLKYTSTNTGNSIAFRYSVDRLV